MSEVWGIPIVVSDVLPMDPSPGEWARRFVRHGMRDIVEWIGEEVGPEPDEQTHMLKTTDTFGGEWLYASREAVEKMREACS
jgi:hypothetical protein